MKFCKDMQPQKDLGALAHLEVSVPCQTELCLEYTMLDFVG